MLIHNKPKKWWLNDCEYTRNEYESPLSSNELNLSSNENKTWKTLPHMASSVSNSQFFFFTHLSKQLLYKAWHYWVCSLCRCGRHVVSSSWVIGWWCKSLHSTKRQSTHYLYNYNTTTHLNQLSSLLCKFPPLDLWPNK